MLLKRFNTPGLAINSYLLWDEASLKGVVVDPTRAIQTYLAFAFEHNILITDIIETHVHADFISGAKELKAALHAEPTIHCSGLGTEDWIPKYTDHVVGDRDSFHVGTIRLEAWHTPGHTPEHLMWVVYDETKNKNPPKMAFTGDFIFSGSVGRPDLLGPQARELLTRQLYHSIFETIKPLADDLEIHSGHGAGSLCGKNIGNKDFSTLGYERQNNTMLKPRDYVTWKTHLLDNTSNPPQYFNRMKQLNVQGIEESEFSQEMPLMMTNMQIKREHVVIDTRPPDAFAVGHIQGAINVPLGPNFALWAGIAIPYQKELLLVVDTAHQAVSIMETLRLIGLDQIRGIINADKWTAEEKQTLEVTPLLPVQTLKEQKAIWEIIDVRTPGEWQEGHIEGAQHIELTKFPHAMSELPQGKPLAIICRSGARASVITSLLAHAGHAQVRNVQGGMLSWVKSGFTTQAGH